MTMPPESKRYWKSLERLYDSEALSRTGPEFVEGAELPPEGRSRRRMLQLLGASFALAGAVSCRRPEETIVPFVEAPEDYVPGVSKHYATTMRLGTEAFGVLAESHEARPTKIEGNELHPASLGAASAWMQAAVLSLYDPDRSTGVRKRSEKNGSHEPASWDEWLATWRSEAERFEPRRGRGLALLAEPYASPAFHGLAEAFRERFPEATFTVYEPSGDENAFEGARLALGRPLRSLYHFENARRVLSLDGDFLSTEPNALAHAKDFARARRAEGGDMSRLYVVESGLSLTGANADHRLAVPSRRIPLVAAHLAKALGAELAFLDGLELPSLDSVVDGAVARIAADLLEARGESLIVVGRHQPPVLHGLALILNQMLGSFGATVTFREAMDTRWGEHRALGELVERMKAGEIETLITLGGNPVYDAPADLELEKQLRKVGLSVHLSSHLDETSRLVDWHLPRKHFLESWDDARAVDGTPSLVQPLIAPLFDGRTPLELLGALVRDEDVSGFELVRDTWLPSILGESNVEPKWNRAVHDGVFPEGAPPDVSAEVTPDGLASIASELQPILDIGESELELVFRLSPAVHDGRFANNGWLQELPDPVTKLTWDNAAIVSPKTAERLGVQTSDQVTIENGGRRLTAPVLVLPGVADGSVSLALGYDRTAAGRVGTGVGVRASAVRTLDAAYLASGVLIEKTDGRHPLAVTQEHWSMEGRDLVRERPLSELGGEHESSAHGDEPEPLIPSPALDGEHQWGMAIDLNACQGCNACVTACQAENNVPIVGKEQVLRGREMQWLRIDRYFKGEPEAPDVAFQPVPCMHCENAPCEQVCPVGATLHDSEGLNAMVYNRCIGTRYCSNNCPYKVRRFNFFNYTKDLPEIVSLSMNPDVTVRSRGVMEKCTYCVQRIHEAKRTARFEGRPLQDGDVRTACQQSCPAEAIAFGDLTDPESRVSKLKKSSRNYVLLEELHHRPRTSYLEKIRNPNPSWGREP